MKNKYFKQVAGLFVALIVIYGIYAVAMSRHFSEEDMTDQASVSQGKLVVTTAAFMEQMLTRWLPNDLLLPRFVIDDVPNFQLGVLDIARHNTRVLRDNLSRMRTTDQIDQDLEEAFKLFANDEYQWMLPSAESKFSKGVEALHQFNKRLDGGSANYYPRADNLIQLIEQYISALGGINTRLINAKGGLLLTYETEIDTAKSGESLVDTKVSRFEIDDNFFYAKGAAYALLLSMRAIRDDFEEVLKDKNSVGLADKIIEILALSDLSPLIVFNADYDSIFANHSGSMAALLQDVRAKMSSLSRALKDG